MAEVERMTRREISCIIKRGKQEELNDKKNKKQKRDFLSKT